MYNYPKLPTLLRLFSFFTAEDKLKSALVKIRDLEDSLKSLKDDVSVLSAFGSSVCASVSCRNKVNKQNITLKFHILISLQKPISAHI